MESKDFIFSLRHASYDFRMTSLVISSLAFVFGFSFALAQAQNTLLVPHVKERQFQIELETGRISVFGKTYKAAERCNEDTNMNPKELRVFTVKGSANVIVTWCTGSLGLAVLVLSFLF